MIFTIIVWIVAVFVIIDIYSRIKDVWNEFIKSNRFLHTRVEDLQKQIHDLEKELRKSNGKDEVDWDAWKYGDA